MIGRLGIYLVLGIAVAAIVGPWVVPDQPTAQALAERLTGPN